MKREFRSSLRLRPTLKKLTLKYPLVGKLAGWLVYLWRGIPASSPAYGANGIYFHIDRPRRQKLLRLVKGPIVVSGWAVDLQARDAINVRVQIDKRGYRLHPRMRDDVQRTFAAAGKLPVECGFEMEANLPTGVHHLLVEIETSSNDWAPIQETILLCLPLFSRQIKAFTYEQWVKIESALSTQELPEIRKHIDIMGHKPRFSVVVDARQGSGVQETIRSLEGQIYSNWDLHVLIAVDAPLRPDLRSEIRLVSNVSMSDLAGDFVVFVKSGDKLARTMLYEFANAINARPELDMIYADEDRTTLNGERIEPLFKPDWSPDYLETLNYIGFPACYRTSLADGCFEKGHCYDFTLRFTERTGRIHHVRKVLYHRSVPPEGGGEAAGAKAALDVAALGDRLRRTGRSGEVRQGDENAAWYDIRLTQRRTPLVSLIIPTAGKVVALQDREIDLIVNCVSQIAERSSYKHIEIVVVDNGNLPPEKTATLKRFGCRFITYSEPAFNVAKKLNLGASIARGEMLLLLNDDIEVVTPDWIERMLEHFEKEHVGVVGAKLLYPSQSTQHVGVVLNSGSPDHVRRLYPRDDRGYFFSTCGARNFIAVTGACMMTPSDLYGRVGGFSEELAISYNDVDYCMKVRAQGLYVVYAPRAELIHLEAQSRQASLDIREANFFQQKWARESASDPFYNERMLTVVPATFEPRINARLL